jgi:hypothetical protein
MKKVIFTTLVLFSIALCSNGQGLYFRAGLGYAVPQAGQTMYDTPIPFNGYPTGYNGTRRNTNTAQGYSINSASFSSGLQGVVGLGYMINENVGVQLDGCIGLSNKKYTFNDNNVSLSSGNGGTLPGNIVTTQQAKSLFILMPSLVLQTGDVFKIYSRFGLALPVSATINQDQAISNAPGTGALTVDVYSWQLKTSFSLGFSAAAGVKYKLNDRVSVWGEVSFLSLTVNAKEQDIKSITETAQGQVQNIPVSYYQNAPVIKFSKNATVDSTYSTMPAYSIPFSNLAFNVGISFNLSDGKRKNNKDIDRTKTYKRR